MQTLPQETHQHFEYKNVPLHYRTVREHNTVYQYFWSVASAEFVQADLQKQSCDGFTIRAHESQLGVACGKVWFCQVHGRGKAGAWTEPGSANRDWLENGLVRTPFRSPLRSFLNYNITHFHNDPKPQNRITVLYSTSSAHRHIQGVSRL